MHAIRLLAVSALIAFPLSAQSAVMHAQPGPLAPIEGESELVAGNPADWTSVAFMPTASTLLAGAAVAGKIYAIGGQDSLGTTLALNQEYDTATNSWLSKDPMDAPRFGAAAATLGGLVYVCGGMNPPIILDTVVAYDPGTDDWSPQPSMQIPRYGCAAVVLDGKLYVMGGFVSGSAISLMEVYDPGTGMWTYLSPMPTPRYLLAAAVVNGKIYAIGGMNGTTHETAVEEYDPVANSWTIRADMPTGRQALAAAVLEGKIHAVGGTTPGGTFVVNAEVYDPVANSWTTEPSMPTARQGLAFVASGGIGYAIGGSADVAYANAERLRLFGAILWDQSASSFTWGWVEGAFTDFPGSDTFHVNDVSTGGETWDIQQVTTYFTTGNSAWGPGSIPLARLQVYPKTGPLPSNALDVAPEYIVPAALTKVGSIWRLSADTSGIAELQGIQGDYWIGLSPVMNFAAQGQEFHLDATTLMGDQTAVRNPGGDWGAGSSWVSMAAFSIALGYGGPPYETTIKLLGEVVEGTWTHLGYGLAGIAGVPSLVGTGTLIGGSPTSLTLAVAKPSALAIFFASIFSAPVPFKGGTLVPFPVLTTIAVTTLPGGTLPLAFPWPVGLPAGFSLWFQYAISDAAAINGVSLSNALQATTP